MKKLQRTGALVLLVAVLAMAALAACGDDAPRPAATTAATATTAAGAQRIVSLSPTATEMLFAIGAGAQVVAVDDQSNYPPEAPKSALSGFTPNVEAIAAYQPDLVVIADNPGDLQASLTKIGVTVILQAPAENLDDSYAQIAELGAATGHAAEASALNDRIRSRVAELAAGLPQTVKGMTYYHELDPTLFTASSKTFIGSVYALLGLVNIADEADATGSGYPQLNAEYVLKADPDVIFLADTKCCAQNAASLAQRPGWADITALRNNAVVELDDDIASRWGPRVVTFIEVVAAKLQVVPAGR